MPKMGIIRILDLACEALTCLVAAIKTKNFDQNNSSYFIGIDTNLTCARMSALNLMFYNVNGVIIWGNSLSLGVYGALMTQRNIVLRGNIYEINKNTAKNLIFCKNNSQSHLIIKRQK